MSGCPGHRQVGRDLHAAGAVGRGAEPEAGGRGRHAGAPDHGARLDPLRADRDALGVDRRDGRAEPHSHAELLERALRGLRKGRVERREQARRRLDQDDARGARIDRAEVRRQRAVRELRDGAGHLDAGRPAADDDEIQQPRALVRILLGLGLLEGEQDAAANVGRVIDGLQPGRGGGPVVVTEIGVLRAGREDQVVERDAAAFGDHHALRDVDRPKPCRARHSRSGRAPGCCGSARRSRPARARRSRPDRAEAGTGDSCAGR